MGILPVPFEEISIQKHPRNKYLSLLGKFPSNDLLLIVGKVTEDTGDTGSCLGCFGSAILEFRGVRNFIQIGFISRNSAKFFTVQFRGIPRNSV